MKIDYEEGDIVFVKSDQKHVMNDFEGTVVSVDHKNQLVSVKDADDDVFDCDLGQLT